MDAPERTLQAQETEITCRLFVAFELGEKNWKLSLGDGVRAPSRCAVAAGDTASVLSAIAKARARCHLHPDTLVLSCYEAGRDGFWLHRWLSAQGIVNLVVDSASIEVNRRSRRAKTDRLDADKLLSMLMRYYAGERRVWAVARVPSAQQEDERRVHRELERLRHERTAHINRIRSLLVLHNLRVERVGGRNWARWWAEHAQQLLPALRAEIEREFERLSLVIHQIKTLEGFQEQQVRGGAQPSIAALDAMWEGSGSKPTGVKRSCTLVFFEGARKWMRLTQPSVGRIRRQVAACTWLLNWARGAGSSHSVMAGARPAVTRSPQAIPR
ncbi:IS110 family transposase [Paraburkholderia youngii]|uniref:IS110 family transposase n=1 Tax=Paraburkholderia youngii TaxID=2782701 RepID=UPI003D20847F